MSVVHIVMFKFKGDASPGLVNEACSKMLALKDDCLDQASQKPYIQSLTGGKDHSPEGMQNGVEYAFVVKFKSKADRDFYVHTDPIHQAFKQVAGPIIEKVIVVDYSEGVFKDE